MKGQIREFGPKDLHRILRTLPANGHPTLSDIAAMAADTINGAGGRFTPGPGQVEAARGTIEEVISKEISSCHQSTAKKS